ncbi:hypothetical protein AOLI_G00060890 [Acnodon oligacanthus]
MGVGVNEPIVLGHFLFKTSSGTTPLFSSSSPGYPLTSGTVYSPPPRLLPRNTFSRSAFKLKKPSKYCSWKCAAVTAIAAAALLAILLSYFIVDGYKVMEKENPPPEPQSSAPAMLLCPLHVPYVSPSKSPELRADVSSSPAHQLPQDHAQQMGTFTNADSVCSSTETDSTVQGPVGDELLPQVLQRDLSKTMQSGERERERDRERKREMYTLGEKKT